MSYIREYSYGFVLNSDNYVSQGNECLIGNRLVLSLSTSHGALTKLYTKQLF